MDVIEQLGRIKVFNPQLPVKEVSAALFPLVKGLDSHFGVARVAHDAGLEVQAVLRVLQAMEAEGLLVVQWVYYDEGDTPHFITPKEVADAVTSGRFSFKGREVKQFKKAISLYFSPTQALVAARLAAAAGLADTASDPPPAAPLPGEPTHTGGEG